MKKPVRSYDDQKIIVLGGGIQQERCIKRCQKLGYYVVCFDKAETCIGAMVADKFFAVSIDDFDEVLLRVSELVNVVAIMAPASEIGNSTASKIAAKQGYIYNSPTVVEMTRNKSEMRKRMTSIGLKNPNYVIISSEHLSNDVLPKKESKILFPCIVKPVDSSAGRGISICYSNVDLSRSVEYALKESSQGLVIIESLLDGIQFSIETLSYSGQHKVVAIAAQTMDRTEMQVEIGHILPAPISKGLNSSITEYALKLLNGFDIQTGACHVEVRIVENEIYTLDFASRMGGWRDLMIECALGEGYIDAFIKSHIPGEKLDPSFIYENNNIFPPEFCVARMAFTLNDQLLLDDLMKSGSCEFQCVDKFFLKKIQGSPKLSLSNSAGHFLYKSNIEREQIFVSKFDCPNLLEDLNYLPGT